MRASWWSFLEDCCLKWDRRGRGGGVYICTLAAESVSGNIEGIVEKLGDMIDLGVVIYWIVENGESEPW